MLPFYIKEPRMLQVATDFLGKTTYSALLTSATQELSPTKIRQSIADLVGQNRLTEADTLSHEALRRFPQSEDILVIRALVTQVRQDWPEASAALEKLISLQGHSAQAMTWRQWVRVLRCMGDDDKAMTVAAQGLTTHPQDAQLQQEFNALQRVGGKPALKVA
jgi:tetratricopeptide (TPR) repeat protein